METLAAAAEQADRNNKTKCCHESKFTQSM